MKNQIIKTKCIDMTVDFYGVCKYEGLVIFVKGMLPDEEGDIKIINIKKNIAYGIIDKLIIKSKYRVKEPCPIAYKCGGCDLEHASYEYQLVLKKNCLINTFRNMKVDININDVLGANNNFKYRNKMMVPVCDNKIGFYRNHSNDIVEFDECLIETDLSNSIIKDIKILLNKYNLFNIVRHIVIRCNSDLTEFLVCVVSYENNDNYKIIARELSSKYNDIKSFYININNKETNVILGDKSILLLGNEYLNDNILDLHFMIPLNSFYQVNCEQMVSLYKKVVEVANFSKNDNVLDLFCGIGTISLFISRYVKHVCGVELIKESIDYAIKNRDANNIKNVDFVLGDANNIEKYIKDVDTVIVDPPRKGINSNLIDTLINSNIKKIVYVSCNPATLARDLCLLKNDFKFSELYPIDMFPNTKHIESIVSLERI